MRAPVLDLPLDVPQPVIESAREAAREEIRARGNPPGAPVFKRLEAMFGTLVLPDVVPGFDRILASADGVVWLSPYDEPYGMSQGEGRVREWLVFDVGGRWLGEVELPDPARFRPMEVGADYVLGVWTDDLDVEYVQKYEIRRDY